MFIVLGVVATKGGVGKTTIAANLGGLLTDIGYRVLLIDADVQPSLSKYFQLSHLAQNGLTQMVMAGALTRDCISEVRLPPEGIRQGRVLENANGGLLHVVQSDTRDGKLQEFLSNRIDRLVRIRMAIRNASLSEHYDVVIIDTQGAVGHLQDAAVNASDLLITPVSPDIISAREFVNGTSMLLDRIESAVNLGYTVPAMRAVINRIERTTDSRAVADLIRDQFVTLRARVTVLNTVIPSLAAYKKAALSQIPVHWFDAVKAGDQMHALMWELLPHLRGRFAPNHRGVLDEALIPPETPDTSLEHESAPTGGED